MSFDVDWPHGHVVEPWGFPARIICLDAKGETPIVVLATREDGKEAVYRFENEGGTRCGTAHLANAPKPRPRHVRWVNMYPDGAFKSEAEAEASATCTRIACLRIEFEEGEGL